MMKASTLKKSIEQQKDEYIGIASHELRTPVSSVSLYAELLADHLDLKNNIKASKIYHDMLGQIKRLINLIDDLLVVNEIERNSLTLNIKSFDVNKFVKKIVHTLKSSTVSHTIILKGKVKNRVLGDEDRLTQVLINLISNSIKYSPQADSVVVEIKDVNHKVLVSIQDFGQGIDNKEIKNIFKRYFRSYSLDKGNLPGLGLGLYISKQIINKHNEKIWVQSKKGKGSTFFFSIAME